MPHRRSKSADDGESQLTEREKLSEQVIAALKYLADECRRTELTNFAGIVEDAFDKCLQLYIAEQREGLAEKLVDDVPLPDKPLN